MDNKQILEAMKARIASLFSKEVKLSTEYILEDGTKVSVGEAEWAVGSEIFLLNEAGENTPMADGNYVLEDGSKFSVKENKISVIGNPVEEVIVEEEEVEMADEVIVEDAPVEEVKPNEEIVAINERLDKIETDLASILELMSSMTEMSENMKSEFNKVMNTPGAKTENKKTNVGFKSEKSESDVQAMIDRVKNKIKAETK